MKMMMTFYISLVHPFFRQTQAEWKLTCLAKHVSSFCKDAAVQESNELPAVFGSWSQCSDSEEA